MFFGAHRQAQSKRIAELEARQEQCDATAADQEDRMARLVVRLEEASSANALMEKGLQALLKGATEAKASRDTLALEVQAIAQKQVGGVGGPAAMTNGMESVGGV